MWWYCTTFPSNTEIVYVGTRLLISETTLTHIYCTGAFAKSNRSAHYGGCYIYYSPRILLSKSLCHFWRLLGLCCWQHLVAITNKYGRKKVNFRSIFNWYLLEICVVPSTYHITNKLNIYRTKWRHLWRELIPN